MVTQDETFVRCSWTFRSICLALPIIIHLRGGSCLDYVHGKASSVALEPDISSILFVVSVSLALNRILAKIIPFYADEAQCPLMAKIETLLICLIMILANVVLCDLALRAIWIPIQYGLWFIWRKGILKFLVKAILYFVKDVVPFRPYYLKALAASSSKKGFYLLRLTTVLLILQSVLVRLERYPKPIETTIARDSSIPSCDAPEGSHKSNAQIKHLITSPSS